MENQAWMVLEPWALFAVLLPTCYRRVQAPLSFSSHVSPPGKHKSWSRTRLTCKPLASSSESLPHCYSETMCLVWDLAAPSRDPHISIPTRAELFLCYNKHCLILGRKPWVQIFVSRILEAFYSCPHEPKIAESEDQFELLGNSNDSQYTMACQRVCSVLTFTFHKSWDGCYYFIILRPNLWLRGWGTEGLNTFPKRHN